MMAAICKNFHSSTNNVQTRVTKMFSDALCSERAPLVSYYGAIAGLQELGPEVRCRIIFFQLCSIYFTSFFKFDSTSSQVIKVFVLPHIAALAAKIDAALDSGNLGVSSVEEIAAKNIRSRPSLVP